MEEEPRFDDVESSRAPTYEKVLEDELEDAEALLGVNASPQRISELAESMHKQRTRFKETGGVSAQENSPK
ncbi:MAG TPA: hypothetical protein VJJ78_00435 [Candidatus Saccharimonadales bacterium]|nr:hypothetical protein [Candidatus Saccharimonadales bacterium]